MRVENVPIELSLPNALHQLEQAGVTSGVLGLTWMGVHEKKIVAKFRDTSASLEFVRRFQGRELPREWRLELEFEKVQLFALACVLRGANGRKT